MGEDEARFTRLYERFYPRVLAYAARRVASDQAREVADETFLIAWRRLTDIPDSVLPWLLVTARNIISDHARRGRRRDALVVELARCSEEMGQQGQPGADVIAVEGITVLGALAQLSNRDREALMLTVWDGLTSREAARATGCSPATFAVRLHRARRRLAAELEQLDNRYPETAQDPRANRVVAPDGIPPEPERSRDERPHQIRT